MADFPSKAGGQISQDHSPSKYSNEPVVQTTKAKSEGGYEHRRRKTTRAPRREVKIGFIGITKADFDTIEAFFDTHQEDVPFTFYDAIKNKSYTLRFDKWKPKYAGIGTRQLYDLDIEMSEV